MTQAEILSPGGYGTRKDGIMHDRGSVIELDAATAAKLAAYGIVRVLPDPEPEPTPVEAAVEAAAEAVEAAEASEDAIETVAKEAPKQNTAKRTGKARPRTK